MKFKFNEVDAELNLKEFLLTVLFSVFVCASPFLLKALLLLLGG